VGSELDQLHVHVVVKIVHPHAPYDNELDHLHGFGDSELDHPYAMGDCPSQKDLCGLPSNISDYLGQILHNTIN
jgi:hypothetical protein